MISRSARFSRAGRLTVQIFTVLLLCAANGSEWQSPLYAQRGSSGQVAKPLIHGSLRLQPSDFDFNIPDGDIQPYAADHVWTLDEKGRGCVAKVHVKVGENFIVMLPDGKLVARMADKVDPTDRNFEPADPETLAKEIINDRLRNFEYKITERFVFVYNTTEPFADVTSKVMESMLEGVAWYARDQGIEIHAPPVPLVVLMFHSQQQFHDYEPVPPGVMAYYDTLENHVVMHEDSNLAGFDPELARQQLLSTIAHEGAHQILHNIGVQQRLSLWPRWLGEGIAEFMAPTKPGRQFKWKGAGKINDLRMFNLEVFLQNQFVTGFKGETIETAVAARGLNSTGYAKAWAITHYLAKERKEDFDWYMRYISKMPPMYGMTSENNQIPANLEHFKKFFGEDLEAIEKEMVDYLSRQKYTSPFETLPHFVGTATVPGIVGNRKHACFFHHPAMVESWQKTVWATLNQGEKQSATFELRTFPNRAKANQFIRKWMK